MLINDKVKIGAHKAAVDYTDTAFTAAVQKNIIHLYTEDDFLNGRTMTVDNKRAVNFGSCSYLGLETDERLKKGTIDAVNKYGTQLSSSRTYVSLGLYKELEELTSLMFEAPTLVSATTSLAHISNFSIIIEDFDAVIIDHQVHASVQNGIKIISASNVTIEVIRHNNMEWLEDRIIELSKTCRKIWYCADGIYSMYGDGAPMKELHRLMDKYDNFYLYIDDAHGMSWKGKHGRGYALSQYKIHDKMILVTSLCKSFAAAGGLIVSTNKVLMQKIRTCGGSFIFSGPIQPPMLGACVASAKIHLTNELYLLQNELQKRIDITKNLIQQYNLPSPTQNDSPVFFVGCGENMEASYKTTKRLLEDGFFVNIATYPAVPKKNSGVRFTVNVHQSIEDIHHLIQSLAHNINKAWNEEQTNQEKVYHAFNMPKELAGIRF